MKYEQVDEIDSILKQARTVLILQADNPDGDSLGSALALEAIIGDMGIETVLYCGVEIPQHLKYIEGWDRVQKDIPNKFDLSIMVDVGADSLFDTLNKSRKKGVVSSRPCIIIDHHNTDVTIDYATIICVQEAVATAEVIYELSRQLNWKISKEAAMPLLAAMMSDSLGLTSEGTTVRSIQIVSELVNLGPTISEIENERRKLNSKSPELVHYKGRLLERVEYFYENRIATVSIPWEEIEKYSQEYNPSELVIFDMRQTTDVAVVIAFKTYPSGRITGKIRCNSGFNVADKLAEKFGGGGHPYASGFKMENSIKSIDEVKKEIVDYAYKLIDGIVAK